MGHPELPEMKAEVVAVAHIQRDCFTELGQLGNVCCTLGESSESKLL